MTHADILERLRKASEPDFGLDIEIDFATDPEAQSQFETRLAEIKERVAFNGLTAHRTEESLRLHASRSPRFTASLDAAIALVERLLPDMHWRVSFDRLRPGLAFRQHKFTGWCGDWGTPQRGEAHTPALALLIALFSALQHKDANHG